MVNSQSEGSLFTASSDYLLNQAKRRQLVPVCGTTRVADFDLKTSKMVCQGPIHPKTRPRTIHLRPFMSLLESERREMTGNEGHRCIQTWYVVVHGCHLASDTHTSA